MLDQLQHAPDYFQAVIRNHFRHARLLLPPLLLGGCLLSCVVIASGAGPACPPCHPAHLLEATSIWLPINPASLLLACRLRGDSILENCRRWVAWCREKGQAGAQLPCRVPAAAVCPG